MAKRIRPKFSVVSSATNTNVSPMTARDIRVMAGKLEPLTASIRAGASEKKRELPAVCWAATFKDGKRHAESAEFTGLAFMDIDHIAPLCRQGDISPDGGEGKSAPSAQALNRNLLSPLGEMPAGQRGAALFYDLHFGGREEDLGIVHAQVSPSGDGLHLVFIPRRGDTIEQMQETFAHDSGITDYDRACKDVSRMLFLSSTKDTLYDALDTLFDEVTGNNN